MSPSDETRAALEWRQQLLRDRDLAIKRAEKLRTDAARTRLESRRAVRRAKTLLGELDETRARVLADGGS